MEIRKPTVVIVPGAWQRPVAYSKTIQSLEAAGFSSIVVAHPSVGGISKPLPNLDDDVANLRTVLGKHFEVGAEVILLCHSYGGLVGGNATEGLDLLSRMRDGKTGGIKQIIFMSAFMAPAGKSLLELLGGHPAPWMHFQDDKVSVKPIHMIELGFNDLSRELAVIASQQVTHSSASMLNSPSTFEPWAYPNKFPCAYIFTTLDNAIPYPMQLQLATQLGQDANTITLEAGHCPFLSIPDQVAAAVAKLSASLPCHSYKNAL